MATGQKSALSEVSASLDRICISASRFMPSITPLSYGVVDTLFHKARGNSSCPGIGSGLIPVYAAQGKAFAVTLWMERVWHDNRFQFRRP